MTREFEAVLSWGGTPVARCGCGRTHYVATGENMEPDGELQRLEAEHKARPKDFIPDHESSSISIGVFNGVPYVYDCPCGALDRLEAFFWDNRKALMRYFRDRAERELADAHATAALAAQR